MRNAEQIVGWSFERKETQLNATLYWTKSEKSDKLNIDNILSNYI